MFYLIYLCVIEAKHKKCRKESKNKSKVAIPQRHGSRSYCLSFSSPNTIIYHFFEPLGMQFWWWVERQSHRLSFQRPYSSSCTAFQHPPSSSSSSPLLPSSPLTPKIFSDCLPNLPDSSIHLPPMTKKTMKALGGPS